MTLRTKGVLLYRKETRCREMVSYKDASIQLLEREGYIKKKLLGSGTVGSV